MTPCVIHPNKPNNYGHVIIERKLNGKRVRRFAHRIALCEATGKPYEYHLEACHKCDVGACINPEHLYWGTRSQNMIDRSNRASRNVKLKLFPADVKAIRESQEPTAVLAKRYRVSSRTINNTRAGKTWRHVAA